MSNNKETIQQIITLLSSLIDDTETTEPNEKKSKKTPNNKVSRQKRTNKHPESGSTNKFLSMREMHMFKEDVEIDRKLKVMDPCPRTRSYSTIGVRCRVCGKNERVNPTLVTEPSRYKCNDCARSGG